MDTRTKRFDHTTNVGRNERIASIIGGGSLLAYGLTRKSWEGWVLAALGSGLVYRGATGHCDVYQAFGVHTASRRGRNVSIPYELGIRVDSSVTINRGRAELYRFWRNLENLPKFMRFLSSVQEIDNRHSHWVAKGPAGVQLQWDAEIINDIENELIGWRSLPEADVANAGSVQFKDAPDGGTLVKVELQYEPPAGTVGAFVAKMVGSDPERLVAEDLRQFKTLMETGEIPTTKGEPGRKGWNRDQVLTASEESFPASDPPSWTPAGL
jgi:uncharacterized membrane protein